MAELKGEGKEAAPAQPPLWEQDEASKLRGGGSTVSQGWQGEEESPKAAAGCQAGPCSSHNLSCRAGWALARLSNLTPLVLLAWVLF